MSQLTDQAYGLSIEKLLKNQTPVGMAAALPTGDLEKPTYSNLFPRDIGVSVIGMIKSGDPKLLDLARRSLISLTEAQSEKGQFPQSFNPQTKAVEWWHPCSIDGALWWSIATLLYYQSTKDEEFYSKVKPNLEKAYTWLTYMDTNNDTLIEQGESAGWDDEMPRQGTVLLTNALWYWLVRLRIEVEGKEDLKQLKEDIYEGVNTMLWLQKGEDKNIDYFQSPYFKKNYFSHRILEQVNANAVFTPYYLGYVSHLSYEMRCDTFGNIIACISGIADEKKSGLFTDFVFRSGVNLPYPVKVMYPPIYPGEDDWREYMTKGRQNYPWQYHNAAIWPFIGGFWVMWLGMSNHPKAQEELDKLAQAMAINDWEFNEYLHGQHGTPMGTANQSWSMAMYIAAYKSVNK